MWIRVYFKIKKYAASLPHIKKEFVTENSEFATEKCEYAAEKSEFTAFPQHHRIFLPALGRQKIWTLQQKMEDAAEKWEDATQKWEYATENMEDAYIFGDYAT
jgi:hypothetical protein